MTQTPPDFSTSMPLANPRRAGRPDGSPAQGFSDTFKDPQFLADVDGLKLDLDPRSGEEVQALIAKLFASTPAQVARAREVVK
jgi:hypothetical protein